MQQVLDSATLHHQATQTLRAGRRTREASVVVHSRLIVAVVLARVVVGVILPGTCRHRTHQNQCYACTSFCRGDSANALGRYCKAP